MGVERFIRKYFFFVFEKRDILYVSGISETENKIKCT